MTFGRYQSYEGLIGWTTLFIRYLSIFIYRWTTRRERTTRLVLPLNIQ